MGQFEFDVHVAPVPWCGMPKRSRTDINSLAASIVAQATGTQLPKRRKNPHAVALGRKGGLVGGVARAKALTPEDRARIAKAAALARWGKKDRP